ncbi:MAG: hypothetical protein NPIRA02_13310 [Nitrospirales bacterium]|nr:MAG: hypothetical protein NPIRA02_13310 [Nitrospirales bacterium]
MIVTNQLKRLNGEENFVFEKGGKSRQAQDFTTVIGNNGATDEAKMRKEVNLSTKRI